MLNNRLSFPEDCSKQGYSEYKVPGMGNSGEIYLELIKHLRSHTFEDQFEAAKEYLYQDDYESSLHLLRNLRESLNKFVQIDAKDDFGRMRKEDASLKAIYLKTCVLNNLNLSLARFKQGSSCIEGLVREVNKYILGAAEYYYRNENIFTKKDYREIAQTATDLLDPIGVATKLNLEGVEDAGQ